MTPIFRDERYPLAGQVERRGGAWRRGRSRPAASASLRVHENVERERGQEGDQHRGLGQAQSHDSLRTGERQHIGSAKTMPAAAVRPKSLSAILSIARINPHKFRRFSLHRLAKKNPMGAQQIAGHASLNTTMMYTEIDEEFKTKIHEEAGVLRNLLGSKRVEKKKRLQFT
jgi:integrase